jgi:poly(3-hydroxybutyrate) depolymerase
VPENAPEGPLSAIVFLHGSAGNFKAYTWIWSQLAEEQGFVIIAPSFGFGNWRQPGGCEAVLRAIEDAASQVDIDRSQIYLTGLSNGGLGVSQLAAAHPDLFRGLILISPVIDTTLVDTAAFQQAWENRPMLLISGRADKRIPFGYMQERIQNLRAGGIDLTTAIYAEDHFLFFSQAEGVLADISIWLTEISEES